jgi:hypothetical protein
MLQAVIPIHSASQVAKSHCGACAHSAAGPVCRVDLGDACEAPALVGPADELSRVMRELDRVLGDVDGAQGGIGTKGNRFVRSLRLAADEAELVLAVEPHCGGRELAEIAFQAMKRLLPDTDIYVLHAAP